MAYGNGMIGNPENQRNAFLSAGAEPVREPVRMRDIPESIDNLANATGELLEMVDRLESRLTPVVRHLPQETGKADAPPDPCCDLSYQINAAVATLRAARYRLGTLLDSIQL